eukprot:486047-Pleurochrysis_carterae.AAC.3
MLHRAASVDASITFADACCSSKQIYPLLKASAGVQHYTLSLKCAWKGANEHAFMHAACSHVQANLDRHVHAAGHAAIHESSLRSLATLVGAHFHPLTHMFMRSGTSTYVERCLRSVLRGGGLWSRLDMHCHHELQHGMTCQSQDAHEMIRAHASELSCKQAHEQASQCAHGRVDINAEECERLSACSSARAGALAFLDSHI